MFSWVSHWGFTHSSPIRQNCHSEGLVASQFMTLSIIIYTMYGLLSTPFAQLLSRGWFQPLAPLMTNSAFPNQTIKTLMNMRTIGDGLQIFLNARHHLNDIGPS